MTLQKSKFNIQANISKVNEELRVVYGYASVIEEGGKSVIDHHGDIINEYELVKAAHMFVSVFRQGKEMHQGMPCGEIVESVVLTKDVQESLGIDLGKVGWFIGFKVRSEEVWQKVKSGELKAFSIGGTAVRDLLNEEYF